MKPLNWHQLRSWNGDQNKAFEELCCQLARHERTGLPAGSEFQRRGTPDGGVECLWTLPDGGQWAWQAKNFHSSPNNTQWGELDKSVKTALEKNPNLRRYAICLPINLADSQIETHKTARQRWNARVKKWSSWAAQKNLSVQFLLWDESELLERLQKPEHAGRVAFWFGGGSFDLQWFHEVGVNPAIQQSKQRYNPQFHVEVPHDQAVEALRKDPSHYERLSEVAAVLRESMGDALHALQNRPEIEQAAALRKHVLEMGKALVEWPWSSPNNIREIVPILSQLRAATDKAIGTYWEVGDDLDKANDEFSIGKLWSLRDQANLLDRALASPEAMAGVLGRLVITGEAGAGKTQFLCHSAEACLAMKLPAILLTGEQFPGVEEPLKEIQVILGLLLPREEFLGALDAAGEAYQCRLIIMIDALNEGPGLSFWRKHLGAMLNLLGRYPNIGLMVSIRDLYERELRPLVGGDSAWLTHHGFRGRMAEAAREFFRYYELPEPNVPVLDPEYENPLFLKLLCESLKNRGDLTISDPPSFSSLLHMVLDDANGRLATIMDYDPAEKYVQKAVVLLSGMMAEAESEYIGWPDAIQKLRELKPSSSRKECLANHLLSEDLLVKAPARGSGNGAEVVRFSYQRFSDYLVVEAMLKDEIGSGGTGSKVIRAAFAQADYSTIALNRLHAAATLSPELGGVELPNAEIGFSYSPEARGAFLSSIVWRRRETVTEETARLTRCLLSEGGDQRQETFEALLAVASRPDHPLNADWLDRHLRSLAMPQRDAVWSAAIFGGWDRQGNVHRLICWAWQEEASVGLSEEVVRLAAVALIWMFTTSDRFVRDRATKAAVSLLEGRLELLWKMFEHFDGVDDPYLWERLFAVGCGCVYLSRSGGEVAGFGQKIYDLVFSEGRPPASILIRDHARAIVEAAMTSGSPLDCDPVRLIPPYHSEPPNEPPTEEELQVSFEVNNYANRKWSLSRIHHSVTGDDFSHYVVKDVTEWSNTLGGRRLKDSPRKLFDALKSRLATPIAKALDNLGEKYSRYGWGHYTQEYKAVLALELKVLERRLPSLLGKTRASLFLKRIKPFLLDRNNSIYRDYFEVAKFERMILKKVLDLGWSNDLHGDFDNNVPHSGRDSHKPERIGKKYQWIAYDELHARISDNYLRADDNSLRYTDHEWEMGLWTSRHRDLDPTLLIRTTKEDGWGVNHKNWWTPHHYTGWNSDPTPSGWLQSTDDLPPLEDFIMITDPGGQSWVVLDGFHRWKRMVENERGPVSKRDSQEVHLIFRSYLVKKRDLPKMLQWGKEQNWINDRLPSANFDYHAHLFEHYSSPRFEGSLDDEWITEIWPDDDLPCPFLQTSAEYLCEVSTYDCSMDSTVKIAIPSRWLAEKLSIKPNGRYADFASSDGSVVVFDPSTRQVGKSVLLIREENLRNLLQKEKLAIVWTLLGEKNYYPPEHFDRRFGRLTLLGIYSMTDGPVTGEYRSVFEKS